MKDNPSEGPICPKCGSFDVEIVRMDTFHHQASFRCEDCGYTWEEV